MRVRLLPAMAGVQEKQRIALPLPIGTVDEPVNPYENKTHANGPRCPRCRQTTHAAESAVGAEAPAASPRRKPAMILCRVGSRVWSNAASSSVRQRMSLSWKPNLSGNQGNGRGSARLGPVPACIVLSEQHMLRHANVVRTAPQLVLHPHREDCIHRALRVCGPNRGRRCERTACPR
jgi:hypothetical protein